MKKAFIFSILTCSFLCSPFSFAAETYNSSQEIMYRPGTKVSIKEVQGINEDGQYYRLFICRQCRNPVFEKRDLKNARPEFQKCLNDLKNNAHDVTITAKIKAYKKTRNRAERTIEDFTTLPVLKIDRDSRCRP